MIYGLTWCACVSVYCVCVFVLVLHVWKGEIARLPVRMSCAHQLHITAWHQLTIGYTYAPVVRLIAIATRHAIGASPVKFRQNIAATPLETETETGGECVRLRARCVSISAVNKQNPHPNWFGAWFVRLQCFITGFVFGVFPFQVTTAASGSWDGRLQSSSRR